jgi:hypothetical protein
MSRYTRTPGELASKALLDVLDAGLERGDLLLEHGEVALEDLAPAALVAEMGFDPAQRLRDRVILLLEPFEAPVDLIEVPEDLASELGHFPSQFGHLAAQLDDLTVEPDDLTANLGRSGGRSG